MARRRPHLIPAAPVPGGVRRPGQATIELTIVLPLALIVFFMAVWLGHLAYSYLGITWTTYQAARVSSARTGTLPAGVAFAQTRLRGLLGPQLAARFTVEPRCIGGTSEACIGGSQVAMRIRGEYPLTIPLLVTMSVPISAEVTMFREGFR